MILSISGYINGTFTPNGLSVAALHFRICSSSTSGYILPLPIRPSPPALLTALASRHPLVVTTGGTGLTARDVTPQATSRVVDYEVPGLAEAMRVAGRATTPLADLSRGMVGVRRGSLIVNLPGSPKGALESFDAVAPVLDHALETLAGPYDHAIRSDGG